jgi:hypothetical protein
MIGSSQSPPTASQQQQQQKQQSRVPRVSSSLKLEEDVFPPANLDARRLPVANSGSWVNLNEMASQQSQQPSPHQQTGREAMKHSYSQPILGGDAWLSYSDSMDVAGRNANSGSLASLPVMPPTSPVNGRTGTTSFAPSTSSPNLLHAYSSSSGADHNQNGSNNASSFRKAASYANHIWFEATNTGGNAASSTAPDVDNPWSSMARAKSVEGRLNIFRNLSDQDLAKTAAASSSASSATPAARRGPPRLPSCEERLGEVGLALSDDEDRGTDEGDTEDEGFGKF